MELPGGGRLVEAVLSRTGTVVTVRGVDGTTRTVREDGPGPFDATSRLASVAYRADGPVLVATTLHGETVEHDLDTGAEPAAPPDGTPAVYLDQNKWSVLADALHGTGRVPSGRESDAALTLAGWAEERRVILPVSAAHLLETVKWRDDDRRCVLGLTLARLGRGWQLRHPLQVRHDELVDSLRRHLDPDAPPVARPAVTLQPGALLEDPAGPFPAAPETPWDRVHRALTAASAHVDLLLDGRSTPPGPTGTWTAANRLFADRLTSRGLDRNQTRKAVDAHIHNDLRHDIDLAARTAGTTPDQTADWDRRLGARLAGTRSLAVWREAVHSRHANTGAAWHDNDLVDLVYLSCAAANTDLVVCERAMRAAVGQGLNRLGRPDNLHTSLHAAVEALRPLLRGGH
ncbi:MAG: hypothetical protein JWP57_4063 [Spirosoma sp.]|nr:hypothetical protein [Spirosoma sp.]